MERYDDNRILGNDLLLPIALHIITTLCRSMTAKFSTLLRCRALCRSIRFGRNYISLEHECVLQCDIRYNVDGDTRILCCRAKGAQ